MKPFFQGFVLGFIVMYAYINREEVFAPYREWFGGDKNGRKQSLMQEETGSVRYGFVLQRDGQTRADEIIVRS